MKTLTNTTGSKIVNITTDATGTIRAMYCQVYQGQQQVLESKSFTNENKANSWASKKLA